MGRAAIMADECYDTRGPFRQKQIVMDGTPQLRNHPSIAKTPFVFRIVRTRCYLSGPHDYSSGLRTFDFLEVDVRGGIIDLPARGAS